MLFGDLNPAKPCSIKLSQTFHKSTEYWLVKIRFADTGRLVAKMFLKSGTCPKIPQPISRFLVTA
ncbi:MAG: hypothetical protein ACI92G_001325 [Candidatus Pelagisphaera sp.]|jgi:hypothetical protein